MQGKRFANAHHLKNDEQRYPKAGIKASAAGMN
jgi:hypothetical protein